MNFVNARWNGIVKPDAEGRASGPLRVAPREVHLAAGMALHFSSQAPSLTA